MKSKLILTLFASVFLFSCSTGSVEEIEDNQIDNTEEGLEQLQVPSSFNYETTKVIKADIEVNGLEDQPLSNVKVSFFTAHPDEEGELITAGFTNANGVFSTEVLLPTYVEEIFVQVHSIGFSNQSMVDVGSNINLKFGGRPTADKSGPNKSNINSNKTNSEKIHISGNYYYLGEFSTGSSGGRPYYLEAERDQVSQTFLDDVNASLPEYRPVPQYHPEYLTAGNDLDIKISKKSDVWITFLTEGAGYRNSLGFFVFDTNNPPSSINDIDSIHVVLPNASLSGSGGGLNAGDKVKIGTFEPGKTISWVLFQNAWNGSGVNVNATKFFSRSQLNTNESNPAKRQHTIQLADYERNLFLNGFEDLTRSERSDDDFNDLIFYVSANPWSAISSIKTPTLTSSKDSDGDGVNDDVDDYPNSAGAIKNSYTGALAFEDLWPRKGDYDFNDLVLDYTIDHVLNSNNQVIRIEAQWTIKATLATLNNGFGLQLGELSPNSVESVTGQNLQEDYITNNGNNTEADQSKATVILFDNVFKQSSSFSTTITFKNPVSMSQLGQPPYNPFLIVHGERGKEVHLPGYKPTDLADPKLFGNADDASRMNSNFTYKTSNGLPWAISLPEPFDFPKASIPINKAYLKFEEWAGSGGVLSKNWYLKLPGLRDESNID